MADKQVKVKVATEPDLSGVTPIENKIEELRRKRIRFELETDTRKLEETRAKIKELENKKATLDVDADDAEIKKIDAEIEALKFEEIDLDLKVRQNELKEAEAKIEDMDGTEIDVNVNNISAMEALSQIGDGFDRLKQGASEVGQVMGDMLESAGRMEQTESFLAMNMGADAAKKKLEEIRSVTDKLPGDDVTLQNLLSQAALKDANMTTDAFTQMGSAAADYMAAMQNFGKSSTETQQDLMNYILAGNTAEIERSPILQSHIDKLKEGTTVQERAKLLQEALNAEGWAGIASQDTYNNKLQSFNDMLERGKMNLGGMFQEGAKWGMDFLMQLDEASGGIVGMSIALAGMASPITDMVMGLGQIATGLNALKDAGDLLGITDKLSSLKTALIDAGTAAKNAALAMLDLGKQALTAGYNALSAAAMWLYEKAAKAASTLASYAMAAAQAVLNAVMSMNPIMLVVIALVALAAALVWAYYNVDWFRQMVDGAWQSLVQFGQYIYGVVTGALQWLGSLFNQFTSQLGLNTQNWIQAILGFILFLPQLPLRLGVELANAIAKALGFKGNFVQTMLSSAQNAVSNFASGISGLAGKLKAELDGMISDALNFAGRIGEIMWQAATNAWQNFLNGLDTHSPGIMQRTLLWEVSEMGRRVPIEGRDLPKNLGDLAEDAVNSFGNPNLGVDFDDDNFANGSIDRVLNLAGQNTGDIIINIEGDVDSDRRINQIVEAVRREISWNNKTANRTV